VNPSLVPGGAGESQVAAYVADTLKALGMTVTTLEGTPGRPSVIGRLAGSGGGRSLMLNAHLDTVGIDGMVDALAPVIRAGRLHGRGAYDMKGSLAACLASVKALVDGKIPLAGDLVVAAVADEEYASLGTAEVVRHAPVTAAIVTEPTELDLCIAHKGFVWLEVETLGRAAHGSRYFEGIDANMRMGRFLGRLDRFEEELRSRLPHPRVGPPSLHAPTVLEDAMKQVLDRHYPVYPVVDAENRLRGLVRGQSMFEARAFDIAAQPGSMVGVEKEERLGTPFRSSLFMRHPWLQLNLLTAFLAAAVVGFFQDTVDRLVILALFLPVLAGQSGNTGCQALAVTLRGMTIGEMKPGTERKLVYKEAGLGLLNGVGVGVCAAIGMYITASSQHSQNALMLAFVVFLAMIGSCVASGLSGAMVPLTLKRLGFDPATASSIFLTTATDVVSMGMLLGLATILVR